MKTIILLSVLLSTMSVLTACASEPPPLTVSQVERQKMTLFYDKWKGTPYRYGGNTLKGIDCSAFVQIAMNEVFRISIPRTTLTQSQKGVKVSKGDAKYGDLVFFKTGKNQRHVGVYLDNGQFMHASRSRGVMISSLDNTYWKRHYWQIRRMAQ